MHGAINKVHVMRQEHLKLQIQFRETAFMDIVKTFSK